MRVLYLNTYGNGSTGRIVDSLKEECKDNGIEALSVFAREVCNSPDTSIRCFNEVEFYLDALCTRIFDNHGLNSYFNTKKVIKIIEDFSPDIIHIHNLHGYWINYQCLFKYIKKKKIKVVWTFHDCWPFTGHCTHFDYVGCEKWKTGCFSCPQTKEYPAGKFLDGSRRNYLNKRESFTGIKGCVLVTPSKWLKEKVEDSFLGVYPVKVINNGVNLNVFKPIQSEKKQKLVGDRYKALLLAVAGDWNPRKGLSFIAELARTKPEWLLVVVGNIPDISLIDGIENIIHIKRTENTSELAEWYSISDAYLNPTLEDNYPTTNLEAIACGTPVATFPTGGSPEIVRETGFGVISSERTANALVDSVETILRETYETPDKSSLDSAVKFNQYIELYREVKEGAYD